MKRFHALLFAVGALLALAAVQWLSGHPEPPAAARASAPAADVSAPGEPRAPGSRSAAAAPAAALIVRDVLVRDLDGRVAWRGDVDLAPTLERIAAGVRDRHRNDGGVFGNRERLLPQRPRGYYREYVVRTPGLADAGPQRLIVGGDGELYYTSDHYASFRRIR